MKRSLIRNLFSMTYTLRLKNEVKWPLITIIYCLRKTQFFLGFFVIFYKWDNFYFRNFSLWLLNLEEKVIYKWHLLIHIQFSWAKMIFSWEKWIVKQYSSMTYTLGGKIIWNWPSMTQLYIVWAKLILLKVFLC